MGIAVSGGPDSVALLLLAHAAWPGMVEAATVDHALRQESGDEAEWVARLCEPRGIPHHTAKVRLADGNVQAEARHARYTALAEWASSRRLSAVATAHHADDQAETLIMRLNRGSGLSGLAGIRRSTRIPGSSFLLLRPLLSWRRAELSNIVRHAGIEPVNDPSNEDKRFDRVRVRNALRKTDWLDVASIAKSAGFLGDAADFLNDIVEREWQRRAIVEAGRVSFDPRCHRYLQGALVARAVTHVSGREPRGGQVARLVGSLAHGGQANLGGVLATASDERWLFEAEPPRRG